MKKAVIGRGLLVAGALTTIFFTAAGRAEEKISLSLPPDSLAQWYKPANERQVWLHNMFKLRRELQAVEEYLELDEPELLSKRGGRLAEHYRAIGEMVPEWRTALELEAADRLENAAARGDAESVRKSLSPIKESCRACHKEYRAVAALLYRAPDFSESRVGSDAEGGGRSYGAAMKALSRQVNRIKIAFEDERSQSALDALGELRAGLEGLRPGCADCHKDDDPAERILGAEPRRVLAELEQSLREGDRKSVGRNLGEAAVIVCARCHAIHRSQYDMRRLLEE